MLGINFKSARWRKWIQSPFWQNLMPLDDPQHQEKQSEFWLLRMFYVGTAMAILVSTVAGLFGATLFAAPLIAYGFIAGAALAGIYAVFAELWRIAHIHNGDTGIKSQLKAEHRLGETARLIPGLSWSFLLFSGTILGSIFALSVFPLLAKISWLLPMFTVMTPLVSVAVFSAIGAVLAFMYSAYLKNEELKHTSVNAPQADADHDVESKEEDRLLSSQDAHSDSEHLKAVPRTNEDSLPVIERAIYGGLAGGFNAKHTVENELVPGRAAHYSSDSTHGWLALIGFALGVISPFLERRTKKIRNFFNENVMQFERDKELRRWWLPALSDPLLRRVILGVLLGSSASILLFPLIIPGITIAASVAIACTATLFTPFITRVALNISGREKADGQPKTWRMFFLQLFKSAFVGLLVGALLLGLSAIPGIGFGGLFTPITMLYFAAAFAALPFVLSIVHTAFERLHKSANTAEKYEDTYAKAHRQAPLPWSARLFLALPAGGVLAIAISFFAPGILSAATIMGIVALVALAQPAITGLLNRSTFFRNLFERIDPQTSPVARFAVGTLLGAMAGAVIGFLVKGGSLMLVIGTPLPIMPIGLIAGLAIGGIAGAGLGILWPYLKATIYRWVGAEIPDKRSAIDSNSDDEADAFTLTENQQTRTVDLERRQQASSAAGADGAASAAAAMAATGAGAAAGTEHKAGQKPLPAGTVALDITIIESSNSTPLRLNIAAEDTIAAAKQMVADFTGWSTKDQNWGIRNGTLLEDGTIIGEAGITDQTKIEIQIRPGAKNEKAPIQITCALASNNPDNPVEHVQLSVHRTDKIADVKKKIVAGRDVNPADLTLSISGTVTALNDTDTVKDAGITEGATINVALKPSAVNAEEQKAAAKRPLVIHTEPESSRSKLEASSGAATTAASSIGSSASTSASTVEAKEPAPRSAGSSTAKNGKKGKLEQKAVAVRPITLTVQSSTGTHTFSVNSDLTLEEFKKIYQDKTHHSAAELEWFSHNARLGSATLVPIPAGTVLGVYLLPTDSSLALSVISKKAAIDSSKLAAAAAEGLRPVTFSATTSSSISSTASSSAPAVSSAAAGTSPSGVAQASVGTLLSSTAPSTPSVIGAAATGTGAAVSTPTASSRPGSPAIGEEAVTPAEISAFFPPVTENQQATVPSAASSASSSSSNTVLLGTLSSLFPTGAAPAPTTSVSVGVSSSTSASAPTSPVLESSAASGASVSVGATSAAAGAGTQGLFGTNGSSTAHMTAAATSAGGSAATGAQALDSRSPSAPAKQ